MWLPCVHLFSVFRGHSFPCGKGGKAVKRVPKKAFCANFGSNAAVIGRRRIVNGRMVEAKHPRRHRPEPTK
ncbi:hypothetical protein T265_13107, partial [Opisthorchis viverrini]